MTLEEIKQQLHIRYSKALYLGYGRSNWYHFFYGYKRILLEVVKSFLAISRFDKLCVSNECNSIAVFSTSNQKKSLKKAIAHGLFKAELVDIFKISTMFNLKRLITWVVKLFIFPILFILEKNKEGAYLYSLMTLMVWYNKSLLDKLNKYSINEIAVSNDHSGDVFILTMLLRTQPQVGVIYVQHGAAKPEFPENYFSKIFVYDPRYVEVYTALSKKTGVIISSSDYMRAEEKPLLDKIDALICLSHQFKPLELIRLLKKLNNAGFSVIKIRLHPSDRLRVVKVSFLNLFFAVSISDSEVDYIHDFKRARLVVCASSSLLLDAYNNKCSDNLVWLKSIGLEWDYYSLTGKIRFAEDVGSLNLEILNEN